MIAAMKGAHRHFAARGFPRSVARRRIFDSVRDGVANQVNQRIGDLLHDVVVEPGVFSDEFQIHGLAANFGGVARRARETRVQIADRHHARFRDLILQMVSELGEFIDVPAHAADKSTELRKHFRNVGGNFGQRARENIEVIVAIHFEIGKIQPAAGGSRLLGALRKPAVFRRSAGPLSELPLPKRVNSYFS